MRAFIAIALPKEIKDELARLQEKLKSAGADVKWVMPENIHLTLKFLGEIDDKEADQIIRIIGETSQHHDGFIIRINSLGVFPKPDFPRVIWAGVDLGDKQAKNVAAELEEKIAPAGTAKQKKEFSSHITIGRIRSPINRGKLIQELNNLAGYFQTKNLQFKAAKITLFKSTLTPKGPVYEVQKEASLKAS